jgi:hypothetical protein
VPSVRVLLVPPSSTGRKVPAALRGGSWSPPSPLPGGLGRFLVEAFSPASLELELAGATIPERPPAGVVLRPHQEEACSAILAAEKAGLPGFLLADEVGLGKTYSVVFAVRRLAERRSRPLRVLVLAPLSVVPHWRRSLCDAGHGNAIWCVTNYEKARSLLTRPRSSASAKRTRTRNKLHAAEGRSRVAWDVVVCDESHRLKNPLAQRSKAVRRLVTTGPKGRRSVPAFTVWVSATAGQDPLELSYLASLLSSRHASPRVGLEKFPEWCRARGLAVRQGRFGAWEYEPGPGDAETVRALLFDPFRPRGGPARSRVLGALRRRPSEIRGWPELVRQLSPVPLEGRSRELYDLAWEEFRRALLLASRGSDAANALVAALRFRQKASLLRVPGTAQMVRDLLEDGLRPAVSVQFQESAAALASALSPSQDASTDRLRVVRIDGSVAPREREARRVAFQRGDADVVVFSVVEGISLHAGEVSSRADTVPRVLLLHDLRWSALEMAQIEGRTHRDGQAALARYLYGEETVEERMVSAVVEKLATMAGMLGDDTTALDALLAAAG